MDAHSTLPVLSHPSFPQVLFDALAFELRRIEKTLGLCAWQSPESSRGACDGGFPCQEPATVHHLSTDQPYCLSHFREVELG
jgi:hypothetical protein